MNTLEIADDWNLTRRRLKQRWIELTIDDLPCVECEHDELVRRIQQRTGETRDVVENAIMDFISYSDYVVKQPVVNISNE